jgi:hypothetical protein
VKIVPTGIHLSVYGSTASCWTLAGFLSFLVLYTVCRTPWTQGRYLHTDIHALSGIQTHDPSVRASEDSSCLRSRGHWSAQLPPALSDMLYAGRGTSNALLFRSQVIRLGILRLAPNSVMSHEGMHLKMLMLFTHDVPWGICTNRTILGEAGITVLLGASY